MGKHELEHLRKEAEQAIADAECFTDTAGFAAIAKTLMYGFEMLAARLDGPRITGHPPKIDIQHAVSSGGPSSCKRCGHWQEKHNRLGCLMHNCQCMAAEGITKERCTICGMMYRSGDPHYEECPGIEASRGFDLTTEF